MTEQIDVETPETVATTLSAERSIEIDAASPELVSVTLEVG